MLRESFQVIKFSYHVVNVLHVTNNLTLSDPFELLSFIFKSLLFAVHIQQQNLKANIPKNSGMRFVYAFAVYTNSLSSTNAQNSESRFEHSGRVCKHCKLSIPGLIYSLILLTYCFNPQIVCLYSAEKPDVTNFLSVVCIQLRGSKYYVTI